MNADRTRRTARRLATECRPNASQRVPPMSAGAHWTTRPHCAGLPLDRANRDIGSPVARSRPRVHPRRAARGSRLAAVTQSISHSVGPRRATRWDLSSVHDLNAQRFEREKKGNKKKEKGKGNIRGYALFARARIIIGKDHHRWPSSSPSS